MTVTLNIMNRLVLSKGRNMNKWVLVVALFLSQGSEAFVIKNLSGHDIGIGVWNPANAQQQEIVIVADNQTLEFMPPSKAQYFLTCLFLGEKNEVVCSIPLSVSTPTDYITITSDYRCFCSAPPYNPCAQSGPLIPLGQLPSFFYRYLTS